MGRTVVGILVPSSYPPGGMLGFVGHSAATRLASLFPDEAPCVRPVTAVVMEISEEWQTGRTYIGWESGKE